MFEHVEFGMVISTLQLSNPMQFCSELTLLASEWLLCFCL